MSNEPHDQSNVDNATTPPGTTRPSDPYRQHLVASISNDRFNDWYHERQFTQNILDGRLYFNGISPPPEPVKHSPSKLLQCHRKVAYQQENAPQEGGSPEGLFWTGSRFEEDIVVPYLQDVVTGEETYVQNSKWIDVSIDHDDTEFRLKGVTDPVIVSEDGEPLLITEVKTKNTVDNVDAPNPHHRAQLHAYLYGLNEEYDRDVRDGVIIYGSRTTFDIEVFYVQFNPAFWKNVVEWMATHTGYRVNEELPPADPEMGWECTFCSFRNRCGKTEVPYENIGYDGFLPGVGEYRKQQVKEYLEAHETAQLTPTLADQYPLLADEHSVKKWVCSECGYTEQWDAFEEFPDGSQSPICKQCAKTNSGLKTLHVPL